MVEDQPQQQQEENQVDAEGIIANLTAKNLEMEEQIRLLKMDIQELEQLHQMDEEIAEMQKETEKDLQQKNQEMFITIATMNQQVVELESRLEGQMNSEEIISTLTTKNLDLEEQNKMLLVDNQELEQLHQMDEEIIETQKEAEKELQLMSEEQMIATATLKRQLLDWENRAVDYERAIVKFRQKTADLNEELQNARDELATMRAREEEKARADGAEISLLTNANRAFSEIVEAEQNAIELKFAKQHIGYLRNFLPDNFTKAGGDNDCLILCVLFPRLSAKALALAQLLQQKYPQPPGGLRREHVTLSHRGEQWAHIRHFGYQLQQLHTTLHKFVTVFHNCSAERLSRLAVQQMEAVQREGKLEEYFKLLQQNRFDENTSIDQLVQIVKYFQRIFSTNLSSEQFNAREDLRNTLVQFKEGLGWIQFNGQRLRHYLIAESPATTTSSSTSSGGGLNAQQQQPTDPLTASLMMAKSMTGSLGGGGAAVVAEAEFTGFVDHMAKLLMECQCMAMRALNRIPRENELAMTPELIERLLSAIAALEKCGLIIQQSCSLATSQLSAVDSEGLPAQQMLEFLLSSVEKFVGQVDGNKRAHAHIFESLDSIKSALDALSEALENSSMEIPPPPNQQKSQATGTSTTTGTTAIANGATFPPLLDRSLARKQDAVEAEGLRWQVTKKDEELMKLQRALKVREQDIGTIKCRLEMAERQLLENPAGVELKKMQTECDQLREELKWQKENFDLELGQMKAQLTEAQAECEREKGRTREFSKKALFANLQQQHQQMASSTGVSSSIATTVASTPISQQTAVITTIARGGSTAGSSVDVVAEDEANAGVAMQKMLEADEQQITSFEGQQQQLALNDTGVLTCAECARRSRGEHEELQEMLAESEALVKESNLLLVPIDARAMLKYRQAVESINFRSESLRIRFHRFWRKYRPLEPMPTLLYPFRRS